MKEGTSSRQLFPTCNKRSPSFAALENCAPLCDRPTALLWLRPLPPSPNRSTRPFQRPA